MLATLCLGACVDLAPPRPPSVTSADSGAGPDLGASADGTPDLADANPSLDSKPPAGPEAGAPDAEGDGPIDAPALPETAPPIDSGSPPVDSPPPPVDTGPPPVDTGPPPVDSPPPPVDTGPPPKLILGASCSAGPSCASGNCVDGVCCDTTCTETCRACNRPTARGTCSPEAAQTVCAPAACGNGMARLDSVCDGAGQCLPGTPTICGPYACYTIYCASACITSADCVAPYTCSGNACVSAGLLLRWPFDEDTGTTAADASGNGRTGTMIGSGSSRPVPSSNVPTLRFPNPRSRSFDALQDHGVIASPVPASLKSVPEMTLSAWFRTTVVEPGGADSVALGADVGLRLATDAVQVFKRRTNTVGMVFAVAEFPTATHLDGRWHHLAGTNGAQGMRLYLDGVEVAFNPNADVPLFNGPDQIGAGHGPGNDSHEHDGELDEIRIYGRVLPAAEIANLASGNR